MTHDQIAERQAVAYNLLEAGLPDAAIVLRLQLRFNISRATAYRDIEKAQIELEKAENGPASDHDHASAVDIVNELTHQMRVAMAKGDTTDAKTYFTMLDRAKQWTANIGPESRYR